MGHAERTISLQMIARSVTFADRRDGPDALGVWATVFQNEIIVRAWCFSSQVSVYSVYLLPKQYRSKISAQP
jgi:hypothetical protein